jgi:hypothetical protein
MTQFISIEWDTGRPQTGADEDEARAIKAAESVLDAAGVSYIAAMKSYDTAIDAGQSDDFTAYDAQVWSRAQNAANSALTEGWHNPNGAYCTIRAYQR